MHWNNLIIIITLIRLIKMVNIQHETIELHDKQQTEGTITLVGRFLFKITRVVSR